MSVVCRGKWKKPEIYEYVRQKNVVRNWPLLFYSSLMLVGREVDSGISSEGRDLRSCQAIK